MQCLTPVGSVPVRRIQTVTIYCVRITPSHLRSQQQTNAVSLYIEKIKKNRKIKPNFNSFYDFVRKDYRKILADKNVREKDFDVDGFLNVLEPYYKNGEYGYLLNSDKELDLLNKRFIVFELDVVKDNPILFPVVTIIIMETFINKIRRLQGIRKMILIEEA